MTEIFVSGTEVFSDTEMTESSYEWRRLPCMLLHDITIKGTNLKSVALAINIKTSHILPPFCFNRIEKRCKFKEQVKEH